MKAYFLPGSEIAKEFSERLGDLMSTFPGPAEFIIDSNFSIDLQDSLIGNFLKWDTIWEQCELFRQSKKASKEDAVIVLTDFDNERSYFSAGMINGERNFFIQTSFWERLIESDNIYPVASEIASLLLFIAGFNSLEELESIAHKNPRGCIFDYCREKKQIILKLRTADICPDCISYLVNKNADSGLIRQAILIMEGVRGQMLYRERLELLKLPSKLEIDKFHLKLFFIELGITVKFNALEFSIYMLFLIHEKGLYFSDKDSFRKELTELYERYSSQKNTKSIIDKIYNRKNRLSEIIAGLNRKISSKIDSRISDYYRIRDIAGKHKLIIDREMVTFKEYGSVNK